VSDLTDDELVRVIAYPRDTKSAESIPRMASELVRHRAAQRADAARAREIVYSVAATEVPIPVARDIANRVATLLAAALPSFEFFHPHPIGTLALHWVDQRKETD